MRVKNNKKLLNIIMVILIAVIAFCGFMTVAGIKGWFGAQRSYAKADDVTGVVNVKRDGISYTLENKAALRTDDMIETRSSSGASVEAGENTVYMAENTRTGLDGLDEESLSIEMDSGELFSILNEGSQFDGITAGECEISSDDAVFSVNMQTGSTGIKVFKGSVEIKTQKAEETVKEGKTADIVKSDISISDLEAESLNDFNIDKALIADKDGHHLCFSKDDINKVTADRKKQIEKTEKEEEHHKREVIEAGEKGLSSGSKTSGISEKINTCTIQIRCDSILSNMESLKAGKERFVPSNGVVLASSAVEFRDGETGFDVLKRACSSAGIQLEYSYTPAYGSYYIEGINNLYEFDCGSRSGWMYTVNGWAPNYGCSSYEMKKGDVIVWNYTCNGI